MKQKYCKFCGTLKSSEWTGYYNTDTGKKEMKPMCVNTKCVTRQIPYAEEIETSPLKKDK